MFDEVERLPGAPQLHRWADWAELLAYTSAVGAISMPELAETTERRTDFIAAESEDDQDLDEAETEPLIAESQGEPAKYRDALARRAGDVLNYLQDRATRYGSVYPFDVDVNARTVSLRPSTTSRQFYLFLLTCACLRYVGAADRTSLAAKFELAGIEVLKRMLPARAEVHLFGANSLMTGKYTGLLFEKVQALAADLGERVLATSTDFERGDRGDNGLDLVAWVPLDDELPGRIAVFAQAACTPDWVSKQHSSHASSWSSTITLTADPVNMVFIPYDYRRPGAEWYTSRHIHKSAVIDRYRIVKLLASGAEPLDPIALEPDLLDALELPAFDDIRNQEAADL